MAMTPVIDFLEFKSQTTTPTLVLVGLHQSLDGGLGDAEAFRTVLSNCKVILGRARACNIPVAHARNITPKSASDRLRYPAWISGFEPARSDMVFDVLQPSCYSNTEFSRAMDYTNGNFAIAGLFGETTCLSTAIDAHHRRHNFVYLSDASACRNCGQIPAGVFHESITQVISLYGKVANGSHWFLSLPSARRTK
jgi:nicotinamidase-related amidase